MVLKETREKGKSLGPLVSGDQAIRVAQNQEERKEELGE